MILSLEIRVEKIIHFFFLPGNSILNLVQLSGLQRMTFQLSEWCLFFQRIEFVSLPAIDGINSEEHLRASPLTQAQVA
jgi:hypothetical protein